MGETSMDKIITTILSFDDLLFTASVRQVLAELPVVGATGAAQADPGSSKPSESGGKPPMSMTNPLYEATSGQTGKQLTSGAAPLKYQTKIDAGIRINDLTQEVNMPLLRLVHQIYSIIADAIEYDKESSTSSRAVETKLSPSYKTGLVASGNQQLLVSRDCWRFMAGLIELRDFLPEPKPPEKVNKFF